MLSTDDFERLAKLAGYESGWDCMDLMTSVQSSLRAFPQMRKTMDDGLRASAKAKYFTEIIEAADQLNLALSRLPSELLWDLERFEFDLILALEKRAFERFNLSYPPKVPDREPSGARRPFLMRIIHPYGARFYAPFAFTRRYLARLRARARAAQRRYSSQISRYGKTRRAEERIQESLFELFDVYWHGDDPHIEPNMIDTDYLNAKAEFVSLAMRSFGIRSLELGKKDRETTYSGRLGRAAKAHSRNRSLQAAIRAFRKELEQEKLAAKTSSDR